jgi:outer membrane protein assembly factor BamB
LLFAQLKNKEDTGRGTSVKFKLSMIMILLMIVSCSSSSEGDPDVAREFNYTGEEGKIKSSREFELPVITDSSSLLHPDRLKDLGINVVWSARLQHGRSIRKFHVIKDSVLIETEDNQIHSLDRSNGQYKWMQQISNPLDFDPFMHAAKDGKKMIFFIARNHLYCIDASKTYAGREIGAMLWKRKLDHTAATKPHANDFDVIIGCEDNNFVMSYRYKIVDIKTNRTHIIRPMYFSWHRSVPGRITAAPTSIEDPNNPVTMIASHDGRIRGFDFANGKTRWTFPTSRGTGGAFSADLVHHKGRIYAVNENHTVYILDGTSGREDGKITLQTPISKAPAVIGDINYTIIGDGSTVKITKKDLDIFCQAEGDYENEDGYFHRLYVDDVVVRKIIDPNQLRQSSADDEDEDEEEEAEDGKKRYFRRLIIKEAWRLEGKYEFMFRTKKFVFLKNDNDLVKVRRDTGEILYRHDLGSTNLSIYPDISSDYMKSRLYIANDRDVFCLELNR